MGKLSLSRLLMCAKYQRLTAEDYIRLGLCDPESCPDCSNGHGHYVKNEKSGKNNTTVLLNNQCVPPSAGVTRKGGGGTPAPLGIVNNLADDSDPTCNKCKEELLNICNNSSLCRNPRIVESDNKICEKVVVFPTSSTSGDNNNKHVVRPRAGSTIDYDSLDRKTSTTSGIVNLAFVDTSLAAQEAGSSWYQPALSRELAVKVLAECPVGSFIIRCSQTAPAGSLALTVRVPKNFEGNGVVHYLIQSTNQGFRIKGFTKVFPSLGALVVHHSVMREHLPCRLVMEESSSSTSSGEDEDDLDFADLDSDPEFPYLVDRLRKQLTS